MQNLLVAFGRLNWQLWLVGLVLSVSQPAWANKIETSVQMLLQNPPDDTPSQAEKQEGQTVLITGVKVKPTDEGVEIILQTTRGDELQVANRSAGNNFVADISFGQLRLPNGEAFIFRSEKPLAGVSEITVTNTDANTVRVTVVGENTLPTVELFDDNEGLVFGVAPATTAITPPQQPEAPQTTEKPATEMPQDDPIELVVTGEQDGYRALESTTGTKTETPLRDIPQSIQVIPREVLQDRNVTELTDTLETVSSINQRGGRGTSSAGDLLVIRGFGVNTTINSSGIFRDGIRYYVPGTLETSDLERVEILKGPASVLFGSGEPGGIINLVSKQPLSEPYYSTTFTAGSFNTYRGTIDLSGPLTDSKNVRYRLNAAYDNNGSFRDFVNSERFALTPTVTWDINPSTSLNIYSQFVSQRGTTDEGILQLGDGIADIPRERFLGEPFNESKYNLFSVGYLLNHSFNNNWSIRHSLRHLQHNVENTYVTFNALDEENGDLSRLAYYAQGDYQDLYSNIDVIGKFSTGAIQHKLLFGVEYRSGLEDSQFQFSASYPSINIFNPVYTKERFSIEPEFFRDDNFSSLGVYLQNQVNLLPNLKLLAGIRYDNYYQFRTERSVGQPRNEFEQTDSAWTPRVGVVYQPIPPLSVYASYTQSFLPSQAYARNADQSAFKPEEGRQLEFGIKADLSSQLGLTLAFFDISKQNVKTPDPNNRLFTLQTGEQTSRGIELDLTGQILPGWNITASYAYTDAFVSQDTRLPVGNRLSNVPYNQFSLWTTYEIPKGSLEGLGFGLGLFYVGERQGDLENTFQLPSYFRTDAAIFYKQNDWRLQVNFRNLFDIRYFTAANYDARNFGVNPGAPFTVTGSISYEF
jgi:iron complex outermembrane recepter protein